MSKYLFYPWEKEWNWCFPSLNPKKKYSTENDLISFVHKQPRHRVLDNLNDMYRCYACGYVDTDATPVLN